MALAPSCTPRLGKVSSACGCTLTALSIRGLTPAEIENLSNKEIDLARVVLQGAEAKALGVKENSLAMLLRSAVANIKPKLGNQKIDEQSIVLPYFQRTQRSLINANYFTIEAAVATPGAGVGGVHPGSVDLTINLGTGWLKSDIPNIERYFLPGNHIYVMTWDDTTAKNALTLDMTVTGSVNADAGAVAKATVTVVPNLTAAGYTALTAAQKLQLKPTFGVVQVGANSISPRESWCYNQPTNISRKIIVNWVQNIRFSRCVDGEYKRMLDKIMKGEVNEFQRGFAWNNLAEQNKQMQMLEDDALLKTAFFGDKINEKQTIETYDQLPTVADPYNPSCPLEYKANALGFFSQLRDCNRILDMNGGRLDFDSLFTQLYYLKRYREGDGDKVQVIDCMTDRWTADLIYQLMNSYYKVKYGADTIRFAKIGETVTHENQVLFNYNKYDLPDIGVQLAVFHDPFFDDMISAFPATVGAGVDFKSRARTLWFLDFSDIKLGVGKTMSVTRKSPDPETNALYQCVMVANQTETNLRSQQISPMIDRPQRHLIIHNFSNAVPKLTATAVSVNS